MKHTDSKNNIWIYREWDFHVHFAPETSQEQAHGLINLPRTCMYCQTPMRQLDHRTYKHWHETRETQTRWVSACDLCGWWAVMEASSEHYMEDSSQHRGLATAKLKELDISDLSLPLAELRQYLLARYEQRFNLNPRRYEELVADVFQGGGYELRVTSYSRDNGIDIFVFDGPNDAVQGIQVKRYHGKIEAAQIREFGGALVLHGLTKGIYVTTSTYTRGAEDTAQRYQVRGVRIELVDAATFYDRMRLRSKLPYSYADEWDAPFAALLNSKTAIPGPTIWVIDE